MDIGKWIETVASDEDLKLGFKRRVICSRCGEENSYYVYDHGEAVQKVFVKSRFCPNCGIKMTNLVVVDRQEEEEDISPETEERIEIPPNLFIWH